MEYVGFQPTTFHATIHTRDYNHVKGTEVGEKIEVTDAITVAIDGKPYFHYKNDGKGEGSWPFDRPHHIIMNIAIGGSWGGREGIDAKALPAAMEVDYVRVWQRG